MERNSRIPAQDETVPPEMDIEDASRRYLPDATEEECERQGEWAYSMGLEVSENPYAMMTDNFDFWETGWYGAQENCEG